MFTVCYLQSYDARTVYMLYASLWLHDLELLEMCGGEGAGRDQNPASGHLKLVHTLPSSTLPRDGGF